MVAEEVREGSHTLSILHQTTLPYSPYQNAKQGLLGQRGRTRDRHAELTLELLKEATQAWVEREYHCTLHSELGCTPLERYLAGSDVGRESLGSDDLRRAFRTEISRTRMLRYRFYPRFSNKDSTSVFSNGCH